MDNLHDKIIEILDKSKSSDTYIESIERHKNKSEVLLDDYIKSSRIKFGKDVCSILRIYLDTKYWILLRDSYSRLNRDPNLNEILEKLLNLVKLNKVICPVSPSIIYEILKQSDSNSRLASSKIIDQLSNGFTILDHYDILKKEFILFGKILSGENVSIYHQQESLWNKVGTIFSDVYIKNIGASLEIQKSFYDIMCNLKYSDIIEYLNLLPRKKNLFYEHLNEIINNGKFSHEHEVITFKELQIHELKSTLVGFLEIFGNDTEVISVLSNFHNKCEYEVYEKIHNIIPSFYLYI
jgi:hypothetical protein